MIVSCAQLNHLDVNAYAQCFKATFEQVVGDQPTFKVGESLTGIIADWSDQQISGLEMVTGKNIASNILKGCQACMPSVNES